MRSRDLHELVESRSPVAWLPHRNLRCRFRHPRPWGWRLSPPRRDEEDVDAGAAPREHLCPANPQHSAVRHCNTSPFAGWLEKI